MASKAQTEANRQNAQKSTGPRTPEGKTTVRQNALRHGLCADLPLLPHESEDDAHQLLAALIEENQPVGVNEEILVYQMAEHFFFQQRAGCLLVEALNTGEDGHRDAREVSLMLGYYTTAGRGFSKALNDLRKVQKERKLQEIGFVSQKPEEASAEPPTPPTTPPKMEPVIAAQPVQMQVRVEPTAAVPSEVRKSNGKGLTKQPHAPKEAA